MSTTTTIPVTISPETRSFVDGLDQTENLPTMIDWSRHVVTGLPSIDVVLDEATEEMPPGVVLWAHRDDIGQENDPTHRDGIALLHEVFGTLQRWCLSLLPLDKVHTFARLTLVDATDPDLKRISLILEALGRLRNAADDLLSTSGHSCPRGLPFPPWTIPGGDPPARSRPGASWGGRKIDPP